MGNDISSYYKYNSAICHKCGKINSFNFWSMRDDRSHCIECLEYEEWNRFSIKNYINTNYYSESDIFSKIEEILSGSCSDKFSNKTHKEWNDVINNLDKEDILPFRFCESFSTHELKKFLKTLNEIQLKNVLDKFFENDLLPDYFFEILILYLREINVTLKPVGIANTPCRKNKLIIYLKNFPNVSFTEWQYGFIGHPIYNAYNQEIKCFIDDSRFQNIKNFLVMDKNYQDIYTLLILDYSNNCESIKNWILEKSAGGQIFSPLHYSIILNLFFKKISNSKLQELIVYYFKKLDHTFRFSCPERINFCYHIQTEECDDNCVLRTNLDSLLVRFICRILCEDVHSDFLIKILKENNLLGNLTIKYLLPNSPNKKFYDFINLEHFTEINETMCTIYDFYKHNVNIPNYIKLYKYCSEDYQGESIYFNFSEQTFIKCFEDFTFSKNKKNLFKFIFKNLPSSYKNSSKFKEIVISKKFFFDFHDDEFIKFCISVFDVNKFLNMIKDKITEFAEYFDDNFDYSNINPEYHYYILSVYKINKNKIILNHLKPEMIIMEWCKDKSLPDRDFEYNLSSEFCYECLKNFNFNSRKYLLFNYLMRRVGTNIDLKEILIKSSLSTIDYYTFKIAKHCQEIPLLSTCNSQALKLMIFHPEFELFKYKNIYFIHLQELLDYYKNIYKNESNRKWCLNEEKRFFECNYNDEEIRKYIYTAFCKGMILSPEYFEKRKIFTILKRNTSYISFMESSKIISLVNKS